MTPSGLDIHITICWKGFETWLYFKKSRMRSDGVSKTCRCVSMHACKRTASVGFCKIEFNCQIWAFCLFWSAFSPLPMQGFVVKCCFWWWWCFKPPDHLWRLPWQHINTLKVEVKSEPQQRFKVAPEIILLIIFSLFFHIFNDRHLQTVSLHWNKHSGSNRRKSAARWSQPTGSGYLSWSFMLLQMLKRKHFNAEASGLKEEAR